MGVKAIYFSVQDVGKHVKKSKKRFIWKFQIERDEHVLEMFNSYLSGKKQIILDGRSIHEVQKVTSSFQFPFQIKGINCMIVQHGEQFELRINNQVFSHLYNQEKMKREFQFEGDGGNDNKGGYGDEEEYGGNNDRFGGFGGSKRDEDRYEENSYKPKQDQYQRSQTYGGTRVKGWDDEERTQRREEPKRKPYGSNDDEEGDTGFGFSNAFDKFGPSGGKQQQQQSRGNNNDPFESYSNKYSADQGTKNRSPPQQNRGGDFGGFEQQNQKSSQQFGGFDDFEQKPKQQQQQFSGFDQFSAPQQRQQQQQQQQQRPADQFGFDSFNQKPKMQHSATVGAPAANDLLDLDFGGNNQQQQQQAQPAGGNQNAGFDFFNQQNKPAQQNQSQGFGQQQQQQQQQRANNNLNDLMGLEFGSTNPGTSQGSNVSNTNSQPSGNLANFLDDTPQTQPQTQAQPQPEKKKDLWNTDLVSLNPSDALTGNKKGGNDYDYGNNYNRGPSGNIGIGQQQYGGNIGGIGNIGYNAGYGGNYNNTGMGGMGGNQYGGFNNNMNQQQQGMGGYGGGMGMNSGFGGNQGGYNMGQQQQQQSNVNVGGGSNNAATPFDFDM